MNYDARRPASGLSSLTAKNRTRSAITPLPLSSEILCSDPVFSAVRALGTYRVDPDSYSSRLSGQHAVGLTPYPSRRDCLSSQQGASA